MAPEVEPQKEKKGVEMKLNTKGCCFLCLTLIEFKTEEAAIGGPDNERGAAATNNGSVSLSLLNRYLSINLDKLSESPSSVFMKESHASSLSSWTKEEGDIKVALCQPCGKILNKFSELFLSLEKIQMEMDYWQGKIHQQISNASKMPELVQNYSKRMTSDPETLIQLAFVDRYRKEISKMSLEKAKEGPTANVQLRRLTKTQLNSAMIRTVTSASPHQAFAQTEIDMEEPQIDHIQKFEHRDEHEEEDPLEQTPPDSPPSPHSPIPKMSKIGNSLVTEKRKYNGANRQKKVTRSESEIKIVFNAKSGKYDCTKCKKEYRRRHDAHQHYDSIHLQRRWKCDICKLSNFSRLASLREHKKTCRDSLQQRLAALEAKQGDPRYKFACSTCGKMFKYQSYNMLKHNRLVHLKERNYACDLCDKTFPGSSALKEHKSAVHLGITLKCGACHKEFKYRINHQRHERICEKKSVSTC